ncbi:MAG TPA: SurA N-terminal domain-containing protein [Burkholderiales bacterium]|nr:SurA N-terminal domain-containing protein [Burkholderiales bacterium]
MFDFVSNNKRVAQIILVLVSLPFAFFGINSYFDATSSGNYVAKVGGRQVTPQEFADALSQRQDQLRRALGNKADPALLDSQDVRAAVLDALIRQQLLLGRAARSGITASDRDLEQLIGTEPIFLQDGKFSNALYTDWLKERGLSQVSFESGLRRDLVQARVNEAYRGGAMVPAMVVAQMSLINNQQREVSVRPLVPEQFMAQVKLPSDAVRKYYDAHPGEFQAPEQVRLDYVVFSIDMVAANIAVADDEVRQFYESNHARYAQDEQRRASHILIAVDAKADVAARQAARARAEQLLQQVRRSPAQFAELARKNSQDPGSAAQGGDLGWFPRGAMVKPFDETVFGMKPGQISDLVETQYGYHIIRLDAVKGRGFDEIKAQVAGDLRRQKAAQQFSRLAEQLNDLAFEQGGSLQSAADALKLTIQHSGWISRSSNNDKLLDNPKLLQAVFSDDVLKNKRNTDAIDVGGNILVVARLADYRPASARPFAEVSADIEKYLVRQQAAQIAVEQGRSLLDQLRRGATVAVGWSPPKAVGHSIVQESADPLLREIFSTDIGKLPAYGGVENPQGGFMLFRISRVSEKDEADGSAGLETLRGQLQQIAGQEELNAYIAALKSDTDVKVNQKMLEKQQ